MENIKIICLDNVKEVLKIKDSTDEFKNLNITEFITQLKLNESIFIKDDNVIPFRVFDDKVVFVAADNQNILSDFKNALSKINSLGSLLEVPVDDVISGKLDKCKYYFIINGKYKIIEEHPKKRENRIQSKSTQ